MRRASRERATRSFIAEICAEIRRDALRCAKVRRDVSNCAEITPRSRRDIRRDAPRCAEMRRDDAEMRPSLCQVRKCAERCLTALAETSDIRPRVKQTVRVILLEVASRVASAG